MPLAAERRSLGEVDVVGVAVHKTDIGNHIGFLYKYEGDEPRILHLAFHHLLKDQTAGEVATVAQNHFSQPLRWANMGLEPENKLVLRGLISAIIGQDQDIPYGFDSSGVAFDADGTLIPGPPGKGFTCATFMLATLRAYGWELFLSSEWPEGGYDPDWLDKILVALVGRADPEHIEAMREDRSARRFLPSEVAGAAASDSADWPLGFTTTRALAVEIEADLDV